MTVATDVRRRPLRMVMLVAALAASFAVCELALRIAGPRWLRARMQEISAGRPVFGESSHLFDFVDFENGRFVRFHSGATFLLVDPEFRTEVHITDWGTRVTGMDTRGPETVAFAGDSFTFGLGVNDQETFVSLVCRRQGIGCLNVGFPGSTLSTQLDIVEKGFAEWRRPRRLVFVFFAGNDLPELVAEVERSHGARGPQQPPLTTRMLHAVNDTVNESRVMSRSYVVQLAKAASRTLLTPGSMDLMFVTAAGAQGEFGQRAVSALDVSLNRLEDLSARLGFTASFLLLPDRYQVYPAAMEDKARYYGLDPHSVDMRFPQRILTQQLDRRGIKYLDVLPCFDPSDDALYYQHDNHLTEHGHEVVAGCIERRAADVRAPVVF